MPNVNLGAHSVPAIWDFMLPEDVKYFRVDAESRSSCFACPKVKEAGFHPDVRCCTVIPRVPNFLIGMGLKAGNIKLEQALDRRIFLPEGLIISPSDLLTSLKFIEKSNEGFPNVVCPFLELESKKCGIYEYRTTTCSTFFCKTDRGAASHKFWADFADLGSQVEAALSQWSLKAIGFDLQGYFETLNALQPALDSGWTEEMQKALFGDWFGRERELFLQTAEVVLQNKENLFEIASAFQPLQALEWDQKLRLLLGSVSTQDLIDEALPLGEPESIESLWYALKLSARNLQLAPKTW